MPALAGAADLAAICACVFYLALLLVASWVVSVLLGFTNISILGAHPLKNIATGALNAINKGLQDQITATQDAISTLWSGFTWLIKEGGNALGALSGATYGALKYLTSTKVPLIVQGLLNPTATLAKEAYDAAKSAGDSATSAGASVKTEVANALKTAEGYTDSALTTLHGYVTTHVADGVSAAEGVAGTLVGQLSSVLDKRVTALEGDFSAVPDEIKAAVAKIPSGIGLGDVTSAINAALASGGSIYNEISQRISGIGGGVSEQDITNAISSALAEGGSIYNEIKSLAPTVPGGLTIGDVTGAIGAALAEGGSIANAISNAVGSAAGGLTENDITQAISDALLPTGAIGLAIAAAIGSISIPVPPGGVTIPAPTLAQLTLGLAAVTTEVAALEAESGLEDDDCRAKNKQICGTDTGAWTSLLSGLVLAGVAFDLGDIAQAAAQMASDARGLVNDLTNGVIDDAPSIGAAIGAVANGIAQAA